MATRFSIQPPTNKPNQLLTGNPVQNNGIQPRQTGTFQSLLNAFNAPLGSQNNTNRDYINSLVPKQAPTQNNTLDASKLGLNVPQQYTNNQANTSSNQNQINTAQNNPVIDQTNTPINQPDYTSMINQIMSQNGKDAFNLNSQPTNKLSQLLDTIQQQISNNGQQQNSYANLLQQQQDKFGVSNLLQQYQQQGNAIAQANANYNTADVNLKQQPQLLGQLVGHEAILKQQQQGDIANLTGQQQTTAAALGQAQGFAGQGLQAQQMQNQQNLGLAGLGLQGAQAQQQIGLGYANINKGQYAPYFNPITGEPGTFNQNTGQFQQFGQNGQPQQGFGGNQAQPGQPMTANGQPIPANIQNMGATDANGTFYINSDKAPAGFNANAWGTANGVPVLNSGDVAAIRGLDATKSNLSRLGQLAETALGSGTGGRIAGFTTHEFDKLIQNKSGQALTAMDTFRESAIKQIQSLASGATGLRINKQVIDTTVNNLPNTQDNIETARVKLNYVNQLLDTQRSQILPQSIPNQGHGGAKSSGSGQSVGWF